MKVTKKILREMIAEAEAQFDTVTSMPYGPNKLGAIFDSAIFSDKIRSIKQILEQIEESVRHDNNIKPEVLENFRDHELKEMIDAIEYLKSVTNLKINGKI
jgi:hypothetical protein